ncbi:TolC family protein [Wenyingzhuangia sp. 1_MG-2023]|nr:TolC family protein [Wenyingzhuangia sp. 1_MG-2023]
MIQSNSTNPKFKTTYVEQHLEFFSLVSSVLLLFFLMTFQNVKAQSLNEYIHLGLKKNPAIQKFELQYGIAKEKIHEVNTLPNTEFGLGYFVLQPETRTGAQRFKVSAKQMLPWFGTITSRENYVSSLADTKYQDIVIARRKLMASISQSYYNLCANKAQQIVLIENSKLLKTYETLALNAVEVGKATVVDVLRLQMRKNELEQLEKVLKQQFLAEQAVFNKLLNRDSEIEIQVMSKLTIPKELEELMVEKLALHPELLKYDKLYESVEQSELLNQKESSPLIGFGIDYINIEKRPEMSFVDNGKDVLMPMLAVSIPIFNKKYKSKTKQNELQEKEIKMQKKERSNALESRLEKAIRDRISAKINYETQLKNLEQVVHAETILMKSYETNRVDFKEVLDVQELKLKFQLQQVASIKSFYIQTVIINYLIQK